MNKSPDRHVRLAFRGDNLDPSTLTEKLGGPPTRAGGRGEPFDDEGAFAQTGFWELRESVDPEEPMGLDQAIGRILAKLTDRSEIWAQIRESVGGSFIYSMEARKPVDGTGLTAATIRALADRGLNLSIAIY